MSTDFENEKSLGGNLWKILPVDERRAEFVSQKYNLPYIIAKIITSRGIAPDDVENFMHP